jgi:predicted dienelactone hydrolase
MTQRLLSSVALTAVVAVLVLATADLVAAEAQADERSRPDSDDGKNHEQVFTVGHTIRTINVTGTLGESRPVNVRLWYPARALEDCNEARAADHENDDRTCATPSVYTSRLYGVPLLPQWNPLSWTIGSSQSFDDVRLARGHGPFPVILFSHGNQNNAVDYVYTLETLASFGFIVAAPDHVNNTADDVRIDFINAAAGFELIPCFDGLPPPCSRQGVPKSLTDRVHDLSAIIDALPSWFGEHADLGRIGVLGHSRGTVTALAAAGGSTTWGFPPEPRIKAIMGLAIGATAITFGANVHDITVPALLLAGTLDTTAPAAISQAAYDALGSTDKQLILIQNAKHRHFDSGLCAQTQSAGSIAQSNPRAILDRQTVQLLLTFPSSGTSTDFCGFDTFTTPDDIRPFVATITGSDVTRTTVPATGLTSATVEAEVVKLAVSFFGRVLDREEP